MVRLDLHLELEEKLADFMNKDSCVLFSTGYQTNEGAIQTIAGRNEMLYFRTKTITPVS
ncbi:MAG: hypothetical protein U5J63_11630 [Fodinibius sp.]|nr:hypothetical protein [Fodinibius sp.]